MNAARPRPRAAHLRVDQARDLADRVGRLLRRHVLGQRRRRHVERRELLDQPLDRAAGRAARARGTAPAACASRAASRPPRWPRSSGARSAGATRSARSRRSARRRGPRGENVELRLDRLDRERAARLARRLERGRGAARAAASGSAHGSSARSLAGEDAVDLRVVEPRVGADQRAVERACGARFAPSNSSSTVTASRSSPGTSEHARFESASGSIGSTSAGHVDAECRAGTPRGRRASRARTCAATSAMWTQTRIAPSSSRSARDRVVEVARGRRVDRERRQRRAGRAAAASPCGGRSAASRASRSTERVEAPPQPAVEHQRLEHVARDVRAARSARTTLPCPPRGPVGATSTRSPARALARAACRALIRPAAARRTASR